MGRKNNKRGVTKVSPALSETEVNFQFKLLSAIGIFIIVAGHCYRGGFSLMSNWFPNYTYNIALFVFISGYFYKPKHDDRPFEYIAQRAKRLVIPAYIWNIVYGLWAWFIRFGGFSFTAEVNAYNLFLMPFVDGEAFCFNLGSWFVYPLFAASAINVLLRWALKRIKAVSDYLLLILYLCAGMAAVYYSVFRPELNSGIFKLLLRTLFMLPFYQIGRLYLEKWEKRDTLCSPLYFAVLFSVQLIILTFFKNLEFFPSSMTGFKNGMVLPFITAFTGIAFWLRISRIAAPAINNRRIVSLIADNTYNIMIHHFFGFFCVKTFFYLQYNAFGWFSDVDWGQYFSVFWFYYLPKGITEYAVVYVAAGIAFSILVAKAGSFIWAVLKNKYQILKKRS